MMSSPLIKVITSKTVFGNACSGSLASSLAMTILYPLERLRTVLQTKSNLGFFQIINEILEKEGFGGFYRGMGSMLVALSTSNFVFFYWHTVFKVLVQQMRTLEERQVELGTLPSLFLAALAGVVNVLITTPLWVSNTRMILYTKKQNSQEGGMSIFSMMKTIHEREGMQGLYSGLAPSLILVSNPTIQFVAYDRFKLWLLSLHGKSFNADALSIVETDDARVDSEAAIEYVKQTAPTLSSFENFVLGGVAKFVATILTYPLQVVQTRLRASQEEFKKSRENFADFKPKYTGTIQGLFKIFEEEGLLGWFAGINAKLLQTVLMSALMFAFYEKINRFVFYFLIRKKLAK